MEPRNLLYEGFLRKSPPEEKIEKNYKWHKRYFRLWSDRTLEYYKDINDAKPLKEPIYLRHCENAAPDEDIFKKYSKKKWSWFFYLKTPYRKYHFIAASNQEMNGWIQNINELSIDNPNTTSEFSSFDQTDSRRSNSTSSRSALSTTSSSSNISSPSSNLRRISRSPINISAPPSPRSRVSSVNPESSYRVPTSPYKARSMTMGSDTHVSITGADDPLDNYDRLTSSHELDTTVYDVPVQNKFSINYPIKSLSVKQPTTTTRVDSNPGYVHMESQQNNDEYVDPYLPMDPKPERTGPSTDKVFKPLPFISNKSRSQTLPVKKKLPSPRVLEEIEHNAEFLDEIPILKDKKNLKDLEEDPPQVNRGKKPAPIVHRAKKPSATLPPRLSHEPALLTVDKAAFRITNDTDHGMSEVQRNFKDTCDNPNNNYSSPRTDLYSNQSLLHTRQKHKHQSDDCIYDNMSPPHITHDSCGNPLTVGNTVHLDVSLSPPDYSSEPLPSSPYENSPRRHSTASNVSYENEEAFGECFTGGYENCMVNLHKRGLTYSEVEGDHWTQNERPETANAELTIAPKAGDTGTHYVFVDTAKSNAVKLTQEARIKARIKIK